METGEDRLQVGRGQLSSSNLKVINSFSTHLPNTLHPSAVCDAVVDETDGSFRSERARTQPNNVIWKGNLKKTDREVSQEVRMGWSRKASEEWQFELRPTR